MEDMAFLDRFGGLLNIARKCSSHGQGAQLAPCPADSVKRCSNKYGNVHGRRGSLRLEGTQRGRVSFILKLMLDLSKCSAITTELQGFVLVCLVFFSQNNYRVPSVSAMISFVLKLESGNRVLFHENFNAFVVLFALFLKKKTKAPKPIFWREIQREEPAPFPYGRSPVGKARFKHLI